MKRLADIKKQRKKIQIIEVTEDCNISLWYKIYWLKHMIPQDNTMVDVND